MKDFLGTLNYSSSNEDIHSEIRALEIKKEDSVLCITGSGARTLDLLIEQPSSIVSVDFNPCQSFLLELKTAAIHSLEYEEFIEFMGVRPSQKRVHKYKGIRHLLSTEARSYWDSQYKMIERGVIYQGRWEKYFRKLARLIGFARPHLRNRLFNCQSIKEQEEVWKKDWDTTLWQLFLSAISAKVVWKYLFGDPGFYRYVPDTFSIYKYLRENFTSAFENILVSKSSFAALLFFGKYNEESILPPHFQGENYLTLKNNLGRIKIVTQSLLDYLEDCGQDKFNKYSLSDFSSYTNQKEYRKIWKGIVATASRKARVCERQFLVKREIPTEVESFVTRMSTLEKELTREDDSIFYTFVIAKIKEDRHD